MKICDTRFCDMNAEMFSEMLAQVEECAIAKRPTIQRVNTIDGRIIVACWDFEACKEVEADYPTTITPRNLYTQLVRDFI